MIRSRRRRNGIAAGQRFREAGSFYLGRTAPLWVVEEVFSVPAAAAGGSDCARLVRADDPSNRKTLSVAILADRRRFVPVPAAEAEAAV